MYFCHRAVVRSAFAVSTTRRRGGSESAMRNLKKHAGAGHCYHFVQLPLVILPSLGLTLC